LVEDHQLVETQAVIAFGFPFGKRLAVKDKKHPGVSVNVGRISSLRRKKGKLERIQLDVQLNPGNSGGPVLAENGKVIGVAKSAAPGSDVSFAIPVSVVRAWLRTPRVVFQPPPIAFADRRRETEFVLRLHVFVSQLTVYPADEPTGVPYQVTVRHQNEVLATVTDTLRIAPPKATGVAARPRLRPTPPSAADRAAGPLVEFELPAKYEYFAVGGSGRFIVFVVSSLNRVLVFDAVKGHVVCEIPGISAGDLVAAGADKLIVANRGRMMLQRWDLNSLEREKVARIEGSDAPQVALIGYAGVGPLLLAGKTPQLIDIDNQRVLLRSIDLMKELSEADKDYLFVESVPPLVAYKGELFSYRVEAKSRRGRVRFKVEDGPVGSRINNKGELEWDVPSGIADEFARFIVAVRDRGGKETFHTFELAIRDRVVARKTEN